MRVSERDEELDPARCHASDDLIRSVGTNRRIHAHGNREQHALARHARDSGKCRCPEKRALATSSSYRRSTQGRLSVPYGSLRGTSERATIVASVHPPLKVMFQGAARCSSTIRLMDVPCASPQNLQSSRGHCSYPSPISRSSASHALSCLTFLLASKSFALPSLPSSSRLSPPP